MIRKTIAPALCVALSFAVFGCTSNAYVANYELESDEPLHRIQSIDEFRAAVIGNRLSAGGVTLVVRPDGTMVGSGQAGRVSLDWSWRSGYFCRQGTVGGIDVKEDCEMVLTADNTVHFVANRGRGDGVAYRVR